MAGQLTIDTLKASSGVLATQNGMTGIAKAWVNMNSVTGTPVIQGSFNVSSITLGATSTYQINFTTAMPNANFCAVGAGRISDSYHGIVTIRYQNTAYVSVQGMTGAATATYLSAAYADGNYERINVAVFA